MTGTVTRAGATPGERRALARLLGRRMGNGTTLSLRLEALETELVQAGIAADLVSAIMVLTGPVINIHDEQAQERAVVEAAVARMRTGVHREKPWYQGWLEQLRSDGTLTRLHRRGDLGLAEQAAQVLGRLPADDLTTLPVLAEHAVGDTKALAGGSPLARLVLRALAAWHHQPIPQGRTADRALWLRANVVADDLASQVLVLNLPGQETHLLGRWLGEAAEHALPFRVTLHQLDSFEVTPAARRIFVCENPAVLRMAASRLGPRGGPLVCTEGVPSAACLRLLLTAVRSGARLHWHADLDWAGLRMTNDAIQRFDAIPWRMTSSDYLRGLDRGESEPLRGSPVESLWAPELSAALRQHGRAVMEERVLEDLLADLSG